MYAQLFTYTHLIMNHPYAHKKMKFYIVQNQKWTRLMGMQTTVLEAESQSQLSHTI